MAQPGINPAPWPEPADRAFADWSAARQDQYLPAVIIGIQACAKLSPQFAFSAAAGAYPGMYLYRVSLRD